MTLPTLIARVEGVSAGHDDGAVGERRSIDAWLHQRLMPEPKVVQPPGYCSDLGATVDLCEQVMRTLGHTLWTRQHDIRYHSDGKWCFCEVTIPSSEFQGRSRSEALALVAATLRALAAGEKR